MGVDAVAALAVRMRDQPPESWPHMLLLLLLGDQVYADEVSPETARFIRERRDVHAPPGLEVESFEEYVRLYREAWSEPTLRGAGINAVSRRRRALWLPARGGFPIVGRVKSRV